MCRCKVTGPNVELYFSLNGYKCNLHFGTHRMSFLFLCAYLYRHSVRTFKSSTIRSISSLISSRFIRRFARTWKYPFTFTEFILFPLHSQTSPLGFEKEQLCIVPIRIFSFARRYANFPYNVFDRRHKFTSGHPLPTKKKKKTNKQQQQTIKTNK